MSIISKYFSPASRSISPINIGRLAAFIALTFALASALGVSPHLWWEMERTAETEIVARVNGVAITRADYARAIIAMQDGLKRALTAQDRRRALQVLIDEELLLQQAQELELLRNDHLLRQTTLQSIMSSNARLAAEEPNDATLRAFYEAEKTFFSQPLSVTVQAVATPEAHISAQFTTALQQGGTFTATASRLGLKPIALPVRIPPDKLADYLGGTARAMVIAASPGDILGPLPYGTDEIFLWLVEKNGGTLPFADVKPHALAEWKRRAEERHFEQFLQTLRRAARIRYYDAELDE